MDNSSLFQEIFKDYRPPEKDVVGRLSDLWGDYSEWRDADPLFGSNSKNPFQFDPVPLGVVAPSNAIKFYEAIRNKVNKNNKFWNDTIKDFYAWEDSNLPAKVAIKDFPDTFARFRQETRPSKGINANFINPEASRDIEHINIWEPAYDPNFAGRYEIDDYLNNPRPTSDIYGEDHRFNRGIFSSGLKPGDEIYRGVEDGTYSIGNLYPREVGPHHSTLENIGRKFAYYYDRGSSTSYPRGGELVKSIWEGTGQGLYIPDLGHSSLSRTIDEIINKKLLPNRFLDELKDLRSRYKEADYSMGPGRPLNLDNSLNKMGSEEFGKILNDAGYDHLLYMNTHEGPGHISTIPVPPYKFKPVENMYAPPLDVVSRMRVLDQNVEAGLMSPKEKYDEIVSDFLKERAEKFPAAPLPSEYDVDYVENMPYKSMKQVYDYFISKGLFE